jgi:glucokinase
MLLAGDVGGTKTLLGLFEDAGRRPVKVSARAFSTPAYPNLVAMIEDFKYTAGTGHSIDAACFGVAGPVIGDVGHLTNVPWRVEAEQIARTFGIARVSIINDLAAMAQAVPLLEGDELHTLQRGEFRRDGNIAVIAAGTGLGEALLHRVDGRYISSPGEGGHADFAPRNEREIAVLRDLTVRFGRASVEHVLSGPGLQNLHRVTHRHTCPAADRADEPPAPAAISDAALERRCPSCVEALEIFVDAYGAEAGNLALRSLATGGVFVGGGIAPKILSALSDGRFMRAFAAKPPHVPLLSTMPVHVIGNADAALVGAAVCARALGAA